MKMIITPIFGSKIDNLQFESRNVSQITSDIEKYWKRSYEKNLGVYTPIWQTIRWSNLLIASQSVKSIDFLGIYSNNELQGYLLLETRSIGLRKTGGYIVGGPNILSQSPDGSMGDSVFLKLIQGAEQISSLRSNIFLVIEPTQENIPLDTPNNTPEFSQISKGEVRTFIEPYTRVLLLQKSSEDLLAEMKQKGRYNIRLAEKNGCDVRRVSPTPEMLDIFMELLEETLERDGFSGNSRKYYESLLQSMNNPAEGMYAVFFESRAIAAAIMTITGNTAVYYYGASTSDNTLRKHMPAYLLQWAMIIAAKNAGCMQYDFLGIADPNDKNSLLAGVSDFKAKFGGEIWKLPSKFLVVHSRFEWQVFQIVRSLKKFFSRK